ncbi:MAG: cobyrinate a,c-diamide synthase, partial [Anaerolineaceae bacterium]
LVLDAGAMARSAAAIALGYQRFDPDLPLAGFILNYVAGEAHGQGVASAVEQATGLPVLGWLPRVHELNIPERHLGLIPTVEAGGWQDFINAAADQVSHHLNMDRLLEIARSAPDISVHTPLPDMGIHCQTEDPSDRPLIAVAQDEAFNFTYPENIDLLRAAGADIVFFSPLHDAALPAGTCGIILSGGFPEVYAREISANRSMRQALSEAQARDLPIYAECGGLMALTRSITDLHGNEYPMFGLLPGRSVMTAQLHMGYRQAEAAGDSWLLRQGETVRGHEFHYSIWEGYPEDLPSAYHLLPPNGEPVSEGVHLGALWASYVHLSFWAKPELALRFVNRCHESRAGKI